MCRLKKTFTGGKDCFSLTITGVIEQSKAKHSIGLISTILLFSTCKFFSSFKIIPHKAEKNSHNKQQWSDFTEKKSEMKDYTVKSVWRN